MTTPSAATTKTAPLPPGWIQLGLRNWAKSDGHRTIAVAVQVGDTLDAHAWAREEKWGEPQTYHGSGFPDLGLAIAAVERHLAS